MDTLGIVDSRSIAAGAEITDAMLKAAPVTLVRASVICAGRLLILVEGDREAVETALRAAEGTGFHLAGKYAISPVSQQVQAALRRQPSPMGGRAMAVIECRNAADSIMAADTAVKKADVSLMRLVMGQGIGGKSYFVLTGDVAAVREAAQAAADALGKSLQQMVVIPQPDAELVKAFTGAAL
ncbi:BMC domain-containing protein [Desulfovibrio falkowii]|uniref:BMC domain-containing protein n=1 Tax=Desulfovibrio sp. WGS1351 TaxID=3366814 RepID=UPI00372D3FFF